LSSSFFPTDWRMTMLVTFESFSKSHCLNSSMVRNFFSHFLRQYSSYEPQRMSSPTEMAEYFHRPQNSASIPIYDLYNRAFGPLLKSRYFFIAEGCLPGFHRIRSRKPESFKILSLISKLHAGRNSSTTCSNRHSLRSPEAGDSRRRRSLSTIPTC
jgi:hypothetical protein